MKQYHRQRLWTGTYYSARDNASYNVYTGASVDKSNLTVHGNWQGRGCIESMSKTKHSLSQSQAFLGYLSIECST